MSSKSALRAIVEEYKAGFYIDSNAAAREVAKAIEHHANNVEGFSWLMILLDDHLPTQSTPSG